MKTQPYNPLELPTYGIKDAARYLHIPYQTLRYWTLSGVSSGPVMPIAKATPQLLSFINLLECWVLASLRHREHLSMQNIRRAVETLRDRYGSKHPLVEYEFETDGIYLFIDIASGGKANLSKSNQLALKEIMQSYLRRIDRDLEGVAMRLYPFVRPEDLKIKVDLPRVVMIDPLISFGRPVLADTGISTAVLASRVRGGDTTAALAREYGRDEKEIKTAIEWEKAEAAA